MDQKILFIGDYLRDCADFGELCGRYGISRKTGYKWVGRYRSDGPEGLHERSRRPVNVSPTPYALCQVVLELRARRHTPGPKKIQALLAGQLVGLEPVAEAVWDVYFGPIRIGTFDQRNTKGRLDDYLTLNV